MWFYSILLFKYVLFYANCFNSKFIISTIFFSSTKRNLLQLQIRWRQTLAKKLQVLVHNVMRDVRPDTEQQPKAYATTNYARVIIRADRIQGLHNPNNAMAELACAAVNVRNSVAIKTVRKSILVDLDFVIALAVLICANANILAKFFLRNVFAINETNK